MIRALTIEAIADGTKGYVVTYRGVTGTHTGQGNTLVAALEEALDGALDDARVQDSTIANVALTTDHLFKALRTLRR